jgi:hypothetical protein
MEQGKVASSQDVVTARVYLPGMCSQTVRAKCLWKLLPPVLGLMSSALLRASHVG